MSAQVWPKCPAPKCSFELNQIKITLSKKTSAKFDLIAKIVPVAPNGMGNPSVLIITLSAKLKVGAAAFESTNSGELTSEVAKTYSKN